eukprot:TRINITY_DN555_c0_g1_i1.p1 TRINITY_DN555_c0_g1~~TRINITY_DN555_c0_g1_i1.p1  ORF type:complete len:376 (+),score=56.38 TRINITY_DN555_c0_g1_i1:41-1168(+)
MAEAEVLERLHKSLDSIPDEMAVQCRRVCKENIKGWSEYPADNIKLSRITGGLTNVLTRASIDAEYAKTNNCPADVLIRNFGKETETFFNRDMEQKIFRTFSDSGLGPKLLGHFEGGRLEQFLFAHTLSQHEVCNYLPQIGEKMATIHLVECSESIGLPKEPIFFQNLEKWYEGAKKASFPQGHKNHELLKQINIEGLHKELEICKKIALKVNSPVTFCHNDLLAANIMISNETGELHAIDFEYANYNFRAYDFADHFAEWVVDYTVPSYPKFKVDPAKYPTDKHLNEFFISYLRAYNSGTKGTSEYTDDELRQLNVEYEHFLLMPHFLWSLWGVIQASFSEIDFGYLEFSIARFNEYFDLKKKLIEKYKYTDLD